MAALTGEKGVGNGKGKGGCTGKGYTIRELTGLDPINRKKDKY